MKTIKTGNEICANCGRFLQYYEKQLNNFSPCGYVFCNAKNKITEEPYACGNFYKRAQPDLVAEVNNAMVSIKQIEKLLNELKYDDFMLY